MMENNPSHYEHATPENLDRISDEPSLYVIELHATTFNPLGPNPICALGGAGAGSSLYIKDRLLTYRMNCMGEHTTTM